MKRILLLAILMASVIGVVPAEPPPIFDKPTYQGTCSGWRSYHDTCREERDGPHPEAWTVIVSGNGLDVALACVDDEGNEETAEIDLLELARQTCNRRNVTLKEDLKQCVDEGLLFKTNEDIDEACPEGNKVQFHELEGDAACELDNPKVEGDAGNGWFGVCGATGPGPAGAPNDTWTPWNHPGCCKVGEKLRGSRGYEFYGTQAMEHRPLIGTDQDWGEPFFAGAEKLEIYMCNPSDLEDDDKLTHHYCAQTSQDIMVEGWKNPQENADHKGPGWCNVTTGEYSPGRGVNSLDQIFSDLTIAVEQIGKPKGIVVPQQGQPTDGRHTCVLRRNAFDTHCSNAEIVSTNQLAHSMGAIVSAVWGIPLDYFGGAVVGPGGGLRNNCDAVPAIVQHLHKYAIFHWAKMSFDTGTGRVGHYRYCDATAGIFTNCVKPNFAGYLGRPLGPADCGINGEGPCEYAAWCGWNPYTGTTDVDSGRQNYLPSECETDAFDVIGDVKECLKKDGVEAIVPCIRAAYNAAKTIYGFRRAVEDHAFDDYSDWGGYRVHTPKNWDLPRERYAYGSVPDDPAPPRPPRGECKRIQYFGHLAAVCVEF